MRLYAREMAALRLHSTDGVVLFEAIAPALFDLEFVQEALGQMFCLIAAPTLSRPSTTGGRYLQVSDIAAGATLGSVQ